MQMVCDLQSADAVLVEVVGFVVVVIVVVVAIVVVVGQGGGV